MEIAIVTLLVITLVFVALFYFRKNTAELPPQLEQTLLNINSSLQRLDGVLREELKNNREESGRIARDNREELRNMLTQIQNDLTKTLNTAAQGNQTILKELTESLNKSLTELAEKSEKQFSAQRQEQNSGLKSFSETNIAQMGEMRKTIEAGLKSVLEQVRSDNSSSSKELTTALSNFQKSFEKNVESFNELQKEKFTALEKKQDELISGTEKKLEQMRETVDEKLQKTLNERLTQSFETVGKQLSAVQEGLGEMRNLAQDVGGLKKVLANVKQRGSFGEVQLSMLLEQILAPDQYDANVKTKDGSSDIVEFAVKLPGSDNDRKYIYLPIDAKFPKDAYAALQEAYDRGDQPAVEEAQKQLYSTIKKMAKDISDKYIDPPNTTNFGIMFLPFEGIYAEVVRKASLLEELQKEWRVVVTGPTTLAAILNSLQMGFRTLTIQKRSSEVWQILGVVKTEFEKFGGLLDKAQENIQRGLNTLDEVKGKRTRAIQRSLKNVETADIKLLPESPDLFEEEEGN